MTTHARYRLWLGASLAAACLAVPAGRAAPSGDDAAADSQSTATLLTPQDWRPLALQSFDIVWQTITDSFYDPTFGGIDWPGIRAELRPRAERAESPDAVRQIIRDMLGRLRRSHFALMSGAALGDALPGEAVVPIEVRLAGRDLVVTRVTSPTVRMSLPMGTAITAIDGQKIESWWNDAAGDDRAKAMDVWRRAYRALHGAPQSTAALTVRGADGADRAISAMRLVEAGDIVTFGNLPPLHVRVESAEARTPGGKRVGIVAFNVWMATINVPFAAAIDRFRTADGIVLDLRGNPGGLADMIRGISGHFVKDPLLLGHIQMRPVRLTLNVNPRLSTPDGRSVEPFAGPVALLVDELTASASECFAGGMQDLARVRVFGRPTMGQALPAATKTLPNGDVLMYAVGDFVTSRGRMLEGAGVAPDEVVPLSIAELSSGRDGTLEAALRWLDTARRP